MGAGPRRGQTSGDVGIGDRPLPAGHCRKTANALFALELARRATAVGITANAVHPGGIMTGLQQHLSREDMNALGWLDADGKPRQGFKTPAQGAATSAWAKSADGFWGEFAELARLWLSRIAGECRLESRESIQKC